MTTIAADAVAGVMCSDSCWTDGEERGTTKKIFRIRGALLGGGGTAKYLDKWFDLYRKKKPLTGCGDVIVLRLSRSGIDRWIADGSWMKIEQAQFAIGTGGFAARGAMAAFRAATGDAKCAQSVRIASAIDALSGGFVRSYRLGA